MGFNSGASQATLDAVKTKTDLIPASPASETTVAAVKTKTDLIADWTATAGTSAHAGTLLSAITPNAQNDFALLDVAASVSKTGYTGLRLHISGGIPTSINEVDFATLEHATLTPPQLLVTYTLPAKAWQSVGAKLLGQGVI